MRPVVMGGNVEQRTEQEALYRFALCSKTDCGLIVLCLLLAQMLRTISSWRLAVALSLGLTPKQLEYGLL